MGSVIGFLNIYLLDEQHLKNPELVVFLSYPSPTLSFLQEIICLVFFFQKLANVYLFSFCIVMQM